MIDVLALFAVEFLYFGKHGTIAHLFFELFDLSQEALVRIHNVSAGLNVFSNSFEIEFIVEALDDLLVDQIHDDQRGRPRPAHLAMDKYLVLALRLDRSVGNLIKLFMNWLFERLVIRLFLNVHLANFDVFSVFGLCMVMMMVSMHVCRVSILQEPVEVREIVDQADVLSVADHYLQIVDPKRLSLLLVGVSGHHG